MTARRHDRPGQAARAPLHRPRKPDACRRPTGCFRERMSVRSNCGFATLAAMPIDDRTLHDPASGQNRDSCVPESTGFSNRSVRNGWRISFSLQTLGSNLEATTQLPGIGPDALHPGAPFGIVVLAIAHGADQRHDMGVFVGVVAQHPVLEKPGNFMGQAQAAYRPHPAHRWPWRRPECAPSPDR